MVVSRRVVVGSGLAVVAAGAGLHVAGRDDDLLRALGARPHPIPDASDTALLRTAASEQVSLVSAVEQLGGADETLVDVLREQLEALGGPPGGSTPPATEITGGAGDVARAVAAAARRRESDALTAVSPDLARVLASLAAGQAQVARTLGRRG